MALGNFQQVVSMFIIFSQKELIIIGERDDWG